MYTHVSHTHARILITSQPTPPPPPPHPVPPPPPPHPQGSPCSWSRAIPQYDTTATAIQFVGPTPSPDPDPANQCIDWDTGLVMPCTAMCEVVGTSYFLFR